MSVWRVGFLWLGMIGTGCGPAPQLQDGAYAGPLEAETEATAGVVIKGGDVAAFIAGKGESLDTHTRWFSGSLESPPRRALLEADGWMLDLRPDGLDTVVLLTDPDQNAINFRLQAPKDGGPEGLYAALDEGCRLGVVIHRPPGATSPTSQGVWCSSGGTHKEVRVGDLDADPIVATVEVDGETRTFDLEKVDPAQS
jgi:hypothetical protein